jgi:pyruvate dehydrogenase E2 component (dihydrolipoamide acetyltransferase)
VADASAAPRRNTPAYRMMVSPLAQRIADTKGIDLAAIAGSGPNGRIVRADLGLTPPAAFAPTAAPAASPAAAVIAPPPAGVPVETVKLSTMRKTIARRLTESKTSVPHFYLTARCNLDPLLSLRAQLNATLSSRGIKLSVNDLLIKALALALIEVPDANVQFGGDVIHRFSRAYISKAVAIDGGLVTPVIRDAGALSLAAIAQASKALAQKARDGKLTPDDYEGGTASISNLGMFGIDEMFPVINPPQALILGAAAGIEQPWKVDGQLGLATVMAATASFDHRAIDGAVAAQFMQAFREIVENPTLLCT